MSTFDLDRTKNEIRRYGYSICRNIVPLDLWQEARSEAFDFFNRLLKEETRSSLLPALRGGVIPGMNSFTGYSSNNNWSLYRHVHFRWNRMNHPLSKCLQLSSLLSSYRNLLSNLPRHHGHMLENDNSLTYMSLSLYPSGTGFIKPHVDSYSPKSPPIVHCKVELSEYGTDYSSGGLKITTRDGSQVLLSSLLRPTDMLVFDGRNRHEIANIDGRGIGRIALFDIPTRAADVFKTNRIYSSDGTQIHRAFVACARNTIRLQTSLASWMAEFLE